MIAQMLQSLQRWHGIQNTEQTENTYSTERRKTSFPKEKVGNADLHKPILNKIKTIRDYFKNLF